MIKLLVTGGTGLVGSAINADSKVSSRDVDTIKQWLVKNEMDHFFDEVTNTKQPARYYIDDHAIRFPHGEESAWKKTLNTIQILEAKKAKGKQ